MRGMTINRVVALLTALCGLAGAVAVPLANLDTSSTVGLLGGLGAITATAVKWLDGWQKHEARVAPDEDGVPAVAPFVGVVPPDKGDAGAP